MGVLLRRRYRHHAFITLVLFLIILASGSPLPQQLGDRVQVEGVEGPISGSGGGRVVMMSDEKRPGSWPPSCRSKCGNCTPCKPVHVPIHPGLAVPQEYYPEAWRCKCGNKLYMP